MPEEPRSAWVFRFGVFEADSASGELRKQGSKIRLQEQPFRVLVMLLEHAGAVVSRDEICHKVWPADTFVDFEQAVATAIKKLRQALSDDAETPRYIETLPKRGYRFIAPVQESPKPPAAIAVHDSATLQKHESAHPKPDVRRRASSYWLAGGVCAACLLIGAGVAYRLKPGYVEPPAIETLTYSGRDSSPDVSPDGKTVAFSSDRDGSPRIWLKQLNAGGEVPLTGGPDDRPRFSPNGATILFSRSEGQHRSLYKVPSVGGEPRRVIEDAFDGDFSPDGRHIAFIRWKQRDRHQTSVIGIAAADGSNAAEISEIPDVRVFWPCWSPDGSSIAAVGGAASLAGGVWGVEVWVVRLDRKQLHRLSGSGRERGISSVAWLDNRTILYARGDRTTPVNAELVLHDTTTDTVRRSPWPCCSLALDIAAPGKMVFDQQASRSSLLALGRDNQTARWISHANSADRQPVFSPDGKRIVFSSNRDGHMNLWQISLVTGSISHLTETNTATDYDPAFSPDGRHLIFTSDRSGHFEIYMANPDGSGAAQVTHDGIEADNATMTADQQWLVYSSAHPRKGGIWKIRPDGTDAIQLVRGVGNNPEVSPDGVFALYITNPRPDLAEIHFVRIADGTEVPGSIECWRRKRSDTALGRARWVPPANRGAAPAIAFIGQDENGATGVYLQDFVPSRDTSATRKPLRPFDPVAPIETMGVSPDGRTLVVSVADGTSSIMMASNVPQLKMAKTPGSR
jgi:Tol biopolymer transport system component/DNA-binding winged helix-turn-helix (wHTH) protein